MTRPSNQFEDANGSNASEDHFSMAISDLIRGIRDDAAHGRVPRRTHSLYLIRILIAVVSVILSLLVIIRVLSRSVLESGPTIAKISKSETELKTLPLINPEPLILKPGAPHSKSQRSELKRAQSLSGRCPPAGWIVPSEEIMQRIEAAMQQTTRDETVDSIAARLLALMDDPDRFRSALLLSSPLMSGNEPQAILKILRSLPGEPFEETLRKSMPSAAEPLRASWLALLGIGADVQALSWLTPLLHREQSVDRDAVLCVAGILNRYPERIDAEIAPFYLRSTINQLAALEVLRQIANKVSPELLGGFLRATDSGVRMRALQILSELPEVPVFPSAARELLTDSDSRVRTAAGDAAANARDLASIPGILSSLEAGDPAERNSAYKTLRAISGRQLPDSNEQWVAWWRSEGIHFAENFTRIQKLLLNSDATDRAAAIRELVQYERYLTGVQRSNIRHELIYGSAELQKACAYFLIATGAKLTLAERQVCDRLGIEYPHQGSDATPMDE